MSGAVLREYVCTREALLSVAYIFVEAYETAALEFLSVRAGSYPAYPSGWADTGAKPISVLSHGVCFL